MRDNEISQSTREGVSRRDILKTMGGGATGIAATPFMSRITSAQNFGDSTTGPASTADTDSKTLVIKSSDTAEYEFSVTGLLSPAEDSPDTVDRGTASGRLSATSHTFEVTGEFTEFEITGEATVTIDGEPFDYHAFPQNTLYIATRGTASYDVSATGRVEEVSNSANRPTNRRAVGTVSSSYGWSYHEISYAGEITYIDIEISDTTSDEDIAVIDNGTRIDPDRPLPSVEPSQARARSLGTQQEYYLHLGWDVEASSGSEEVDLLENGLARATATDRITEYSYSGAFQFAILPDVGLVNNNPKEGTVECLSLGDGGMSATVATVDGSRKTLTATGDNVTESSLEGQISYLRLEPKEDHSSDGIEFGFDPSVTATEAERAKQLQLAAELEREPEFEALQARAKSIGGRIRHDLAGIRAFQISTAPDEEGSDREYYVGTEYDLADIGGEDRGSVKISKNVSAGEVQLAQVLQRFRDADNNPLGIEVAQLAQGNSDQATVQNEDEVRFQTESVEYSIDTSAPEYSSQRAGIQNVSTTNILDAPCWILPKEVCQIINGGVDVAVEVTKSGASITASGLGTLSDWGYRNSKFQGFKSARSARALNAVFKSTSPAVTALMEFGERGEVTTCSGCVAFGLAAVDVGLDAAVTTACAAATGGVGALGCAAFIGTIGDLINQYYTEKAIEMACVEADMC